jgi:outer membrane lipoprotein
MYLNGCFQRKKTGVPNRKGVGSGSDENRAGAEAFSGGAIGINAYVHALISPNCRTRSGILASGAAVYRSRSNRVRGERVPIRYSTLLAFQASEHMNFDHSSNGGDMATTSTIISGHDPSILRNQRFGTIRLRLGYLLLLPILAGCATSPISKPLRQAAGNQPAFTEISARPDAFKGRTVLLGGTIVQTTNLPKATEIEVLQKPLSRYSDRPQETDRSFGRFLIRCQGFWDSAVYEKGRDITVAGAIEGREVRPLDQIQYSYPVIGCKEIHLWPTPSPSAYAYPPPYYRYYPWWGAGPGYYPYWYPYW